MTEAAKNSVQVGQTKVTQEDELIVGWISQTLCCVIRGMVSCFPHVAVEKMLIIASAAMAQQICVLYGGDELSVFRFRKACKDSFARAMNDMPVVPLEKLKDTVTASVGTK